MDDSTDSYCCTKRDLPLSISNDVITGKFASIGNEMKKNLLHTKLFDTNINLKLISKFSIIVDNKFEQTV